MITRKEIKDYLRHNSDIKYQEFSKKINGDTHYPLLGVKTPLLRSYAKILYKQYSLNDLIAIIDEEYYEEIMLKGILIGLYPLTSEELIKYIKYYVPKIDNWALCDTFCSGLKRVKKYYKEIFGLLKHFLKSKSEFTVRFSLVMLLNYYLHDEYLLEIEEIIVNVKLDKYYVKMANAWLISYYIIKYYERALLFLKKENVDKWTLNKAISKCCDSYRLNEYQKEELRKVKDEE